MIARRSAVEHAEIVTGKASSFGNQNP